MYGRGDARACTKVFSVLFFIYFFVDIQSNKAYIMCRLALTYIEC